MRYKQNKKAEETAKVDHNPDGQFEFDPDVPARTRFLDFRVERMGKKLDIEVEDEE